MSNQEEKKTSSVFGREIVEEMKASYIDYAMSVIVARALPDVRDGLKPVQRRILYVMLEDGMRHNTKTRKSATVVGSVLGRYHPHGDQAVYGAAVRMAQDFSLRYPLIKGQGNMGSIDDPGEYGAMRYTEMKLSKIGEELLADIRKETVNFIDNYDGTKQEPVVLPTPIPQLLLNGVMGIAVGMATNIPPHNLNEICNALIHLIKNPKAELEEICEFIQGPDFPTGGSVYGRNAILEAYAKGKGPIVIRGTTEVSENKTGRQRIIITEIPYQVQKSIFLSRLARLVLDERIDGIKNITDESDKDGMRISIDLKKDAAAKRVLNRLFKFTNLQKTFHVNMVVLIDGIKPRLVNLMIILRQFIEHRKEVVIRRVKYNLKKAEERAHILEGLYRCLADIDRAIKIIKESKDRNTARENLKKAFKLSDIQAEAILETKLATLAKMAIQKIIDELKELQAQIKEFKIILASPKKINQVIIKELSRIQEEFGDNRKTKVFKRAIGEFSERDLVPKEETVITLTQGGYIKRIDPQSYKIQKRGGKGILGMKTVGEDVISKFVTANTHDNLLFFTDSGKVLKVPAFEIPQGTRVAKGRGLANFLEISPKDKILSLMSLTKEEEDTGKGFLVMVTKKGIIKRTALDQFKNVRRSGLIAISLKDNDSLEKVSKTNGDDEVILVSKQGKSIRFPETEIRSMGRSAAGVKGIDLRKGDDVIGMSIISGSKEEKKGYLLVISEYGYGKRTGLSKYKAQKRGGVGIKTMNLKSKTGDLIVSEILTNKESDLIITSQQGQVIRIKAQSISELGRDTQGVRIMKLNDKDKIVSIACL